MSAFAYPVCTPETTLRVLRAFVKKHPRNSTNYLLVAEIKRLSASTPISTPTASPQGQVRP